MTDSRISPMFHDGAKPMNEITHAERDRYLAEVEVQAKTVGQHRTNEQLLVSVCQLLEESLAVQRHLVAAVERSSDSRSSATVKTSTRGVDLEVKSYGDGLLHDAQDDAIREYARGVRELTALQARQWKETVDTLSDHGGAA